MTKYTEIDFDNPVHWKRQRRRPPPILEGEILTPESEPRIHRVEIVHHHRRNISASGPSPQRIVIVVAFVILGLILFRSPGALILLAVIIPAWFWLAAGVTVAVLVIASIRNHLSGNPF